MTESPFSMCESTKGCFRGLIVAINIVLLVVGAASMATGIWLLVAEHSYFQRYDDVMAGSDISQGLLRDGAIVLLTGGAAIMLFTSLGLVAACTTNTCLLGLYTVVLTILLVVEVVPVILAIVFKADWEKKVDEEALGAIHNQYGGQYSASSKAFTSAFNLLQVDFKCCGWINGSDYVITGVAPLNWIVRSSDSVRWKVPAECCPSNNDTARESCVKYPAASEIYVAKGCRSALMDIVTTYEDVIIGLAATILGLELLMLVGTVVLLIFAVNGNKYSVS